MGVELRSSVLEYEASWDGEALSLQALSEELKTLESVQGTVMHRFLTVLRAFDERSGWAEYGAVSCAAWLDTFLGVSQQVARERVRVARALGELGSIDEALRDGELSYSRVRAVTRVATPATQGEWLNIALSATASQLERLAGMARRGEDDAMQAHDNRSVTWQHTNSGMLRVSMALPPDIGALFIKAICAFEGGGGDGSGDEVGESSDDASNVRGGYDAEAAVPVRARRADALGRMASQALEEVGGDSSGDRFLVNVHVDAEVLTGASDAGQAHVEGVGTSAETARRLACDASVVTISHAQNGTPLSVGRKTRKPTAALRRALQTRDDCQCQFPGCTHTRYVDAHHIQHWADGGETSLDNLILLCTHHHTLVHEGGFRVLRCNDRAGAGASGVVFLSPAGVPLTAGGPLSRPSSLAVAHVESQITAHGPETLSVWLGDRLDVEWAMWCISAAEHNGARASAETSSNSAANLRRASGDGT